MQEDGENPARDSSCRVSLCSSHLAAVAASLALIVFATTWPWTDYVGHAHWARVEWIPFTRGPANLFEGAANVVLFVPLGAALAASGLRFRAIGTGALLLSVGIELYQVYCHNHFPTATDVVLNTAGSLLGHWVWSRVNDRFQPAWDRWRRSLRTGS
jgi:hypothetical protein